jgi:hypothetical protein
LERLPQAVREFRQYQHAGRHQPDALGLEFEPRRDLPGRLGAQDLERDRELALAELAAGEVLELAR